VKVSRQTGFSLVELMVAIGLLAALLLSISGLFVFGGRQIRSGRAATEALAIAQGIVEQMNGWGFRQTFELLGVEGDRSNGTVSTRTLAIASEWQRRIDERLPGGDGVIEIASLGPGPPPFDTARAIRVTVTVRWREGLRHRRVRLAWVRL
jgi:prepilin-type N-terminal cleavage/methylation domain-containing protein